MLDDGIQSRVGDHVWKLTEVEFTMVEASEHVSARRWMSSRWPRRAVEIQENCNSVRSRREWQALIGPLRHLSGKRGVFSDVQWQQLQVVKLTPPGPSAGPPGLKSKAHVVGLRGRQANHRAPTGPYPWSLRLAPSLLKPFSLFPFLLLHLSRP